MQHYGVIPPAVTDAMRDYNRLRYLFMFTGAFYGWVSLYIYLQTGLAARLRDWMQRRWSANFLLLIPPYVFVLVAFLTVVRLPYSYFAGFHVEHLYGLSNQSALAWLCDVLKAQALTAVVLSICWQLALFVFSRFPRRWPVILWAGLSGLLAIMIFLAPLVVDPMFNKYTPMAAGPLRSSIEQLAGRVGLKNVPIFVVDKSLQTKKINAEVTGLGDSTRVVLWDNAINRLPPDQLLSVVAHELGHYALGHIFIGFSLSVAGLALVIALLWRYLDQLIARFPRSWQVKGVLDPTFIPAMMLILSIGSFLGAPVDNAISRWIEHQADAYGLQLNGDRSGMARAFVSLSQDNLADPDPPAFIQFWFFSHPSLRERIDFALGIPEHN
jgi:STE24 endopeptidase